jgi:hypothetical protein
MSTDDQIKQLKKIYPELGADIELIAKSVSDPIQAEAALSLAMLKQTDALGQAKYTQEEINKVTQGLFSTSFTSGYGTLDEAAVSNEGMFRPSMPQAIPDPDDGFFDVLGDALRPQSYILEGDKPGTTAYGKFSEEFTLDPELDAKLPSLLQEAFGFDDKEIPFYVNSFKGLYQKYKQEGQTQEQARDSVFDTLIGMQDVGNIKTLRDKIDETRAELEPGFLEALSMSKDAGGQFPDYNNDQMLFLKSIKQQQVDNYIKESKEIDRLLSKAKGQENVPPVYQAPHYRFKLNNGDRVTIPVEVYKYFQQNKQLSEDVYSKVGTGALGDRDQQLRDYFEDPNLSLESILPSTEVMVNLTNNEQEAIYRIEGYQKFGGDQWWLDPVRKSKVMSDPEAYRALDETYDLPIDLTPKKGILGGLVDTPVSYGIKLLMAVPNALTFGTVEYGVYPFLDTFTGTELRESSKEQRAKYQPRYTDYPVLGGIAKDKGLTGYVGDALDAYNVTGTTRANLDFALIGFDVFLNPDIAAFVGVIRGVMGLNNVRQLNSARKVLGEATTATDYAKVLTMKPIQTIMDDFNLISLTTKKLAPKAANKMKNWTPGDGRLLLISDVEKSLDARRVANQVDNPLDVLANHGLSETGYGQALRRVVKEQNIDELTAVKQLDEVYTTNKQLHEYVEYNRILEEVRNGTNFETAIKGAKDRGAVADLDYLEGIYKNANNNVGVLPTYRKVEQILDTVYGRKIVLENTPNFRGLDKIMFISGDAAINKIAYPKFLEAVKQNSFSKVLDNAVTTKTRTSIEQRPVQLAQGKYGSDIDTTKVSFGEPDVVYHLDNVDSRYDILDQLDTIPMSANDYQRIKGSVEEGKLFQSDFNLIRDKINTRAAEVMREGMTASDISLLSPKSQKRLQEAQGTAYRSGSPILDYMYELKEGVVSFLGKNEWMRRILNSPSAHKVLDDMSRPTFAPVDVLGYKQRQMVAKIQRQSVGLDEKLRDSVKEMTKVGNWGPKSDKGRAMREVYGAPKGVNHLESVGYMVVGPRQVDDYAVLKQTQELTDTLDYMFRQMIYTQSNKPIFNYYDKHFSYKQVIVENLYSKDGKEAYSSFLQDVAKEIMKDKQNLWSIFGTRLEEWSYRIKTERLPIYDPENPIRLLRTELYTKVNVDIRNITDATALEASKHVERLGAGSYFYAEMRRIHDELYVDFINKDLKPTDTASLFRGQDVKQETFDSLLKMTIYELADKRITEEVMEKVRETADMELRYQNVRTELGDDAFDTLTTNINDKVKEIRGDINFDLRFEKKYEKSQVKLDSDPELSDTLQTLKAQHTLDKEALRNTKERKIEREFAPIREDYNNRITKAKEKKTESETSKITREEDAKAVAEKEPIEAKRIADNKVPNKKYAVQKAKIKADGKAEIEALAGTGLNRKQYNAKEIEIKEKYDKIFQRARKERGEAVGKINAEAAAKKTAIDEKYKEIQTKRKDEYKAIPQKDKPDSEVAKLRKELDKKESEIRNRYEQERADKASDLLELRKELEQIEKTAVSQQNTFRRQQVSDKYETLLDDLTEEYKNVRQLGMIAQLEWLGTRMDIKDTEFGRAYEILTRPADEALVRDMAYKANEYSTLILRNNDALDRPLFELQDIHNLLDDMFRKNPEYGKMLFGLEDFKAFDTDFKRYGTARTEGAIRQFLNNSPVAKGVKSIAQTPMNFVNKVLGYSQQMFYVGVLGLAIRSHGVNISTGNLITYQTTGRGIKSWDTMQNAGKTVLYGSSKQDPRGFEIAVTTPTGQQYTYRDLYQAIKKSGVRSTANFVDNVLAEGKLITFLEAHNKTNKGLSKRFFNTFENVVIQLADGASGLLVKEDMIFRSGAMIDALKEGMAFNEAVDLARRSLFDYNDLHPFEKAMSSFALVFYNFSRQSFVDMMIGMQNPETLIRYLNIVKLSRNTEQLGRAINDGKEFPHKVFFPGYTGIRSVVDYEKTSQDKTYDFFTMTPALPPVETMALALDVFNVYGTYKKDNALMRIADRFLDPKIKFILGRDSKYKRKQFPSEYVNLLKILSSDQADLIGHMEMIVGGKIEPRIAKEEDYATQGVDDDNYFIYDLDAKQFERMRKFEFFLTQTPFSRMSKDYSKLFMPEGTTLQSASTAGRIGYGLGLTTPGRMKKPEIQQAEQLQKVLQEYKARASKAENLEQQKYDPYVGEDDYGKDR